MHKNIFCIFTTVVTAAVTLTIASGNLGNIPVETFADSITTPNEDILIVVFRNDCNGQTPEVLYISIFYAHSY